jgi:hypothetical protein
VTPSIVTVVVCPSVGPVVRALFVNRAGIAFRPKKCAARTTKTKLRQPVTGSSNPATPATPYAPTMTMLTETTRDGRGINVEGTSTSEFDGHRIVAPCISPPMQVSSAQRSLARKLSGRCRPLFCVVLARSGRAHQYGTNRLRGQWQYRIPRECLPEAGGSKPFPRRGFEEHGRTVRDPTAA